MRYKHKPLRQGSKTAMFFEQVMEMSLEDIMDASNDHEIALFNKIRELESPPYQEEDWSLPIGEHAEESEATSQQTAASLDSGDIAVTPSSLIGFLDGETNSKREISAEGKNHADCCPFRRQGVPIFIVPFSNATLNAIPDI